MVEPGGGWGRGAKEEEVVTAGEVEMVSVVGGGGGGSKGRRRTSRLDISAGMYLDVGTSRATQICVASFP